MLRVTPSHLKIFIRIADDSGLERDHRIRNLEGRGRQFRFARTIGVAGDHQIINDLVADECPGRSRIGKPLGETLANLAARRRDIGQGPRWQNGRAGKGRENMAAGDHDGIRDDCGGGDDADDIVVKG